MRITITEPCVVECDGPILISPYEPDKFVVGILNISAQATSEEPQAPAETPVATESVPLFDKRTYTRRGPYIYPKARKPMPRKNKTCANCHRTYRGTSQQMYCSGTCKHAFYGRGNKGEAQGLDIHAGAQGVDVEVVSRES